jgi:hypothetical protein
MTTQKHFKKLAMIVSLIAVTILISAFTVATPTKISVLPPDIRNLLSNYSTYLVSGETSQSNGYTSQMGELIVERQEFYREYFNKALHANFVGMDANFETDTDITIAQKGNVYTVQLNEIVTLYGTPITTSPDDFPLIQAAQWAITQTDDKNVQNDLADYIDNMTEGVKESVQEGIEDVSVVRHVMEINVEKGYPQIMSDSFTDKNSENPRGNDNVSWSNGDFVRLKLDWTDSVDYTMYHTPIESLGQSLLADYSNMPPLATGISNNSIEGTGGSYNRTTAKNYINSYTSAPTNKYCTDGSTLRDTSYYNPTYQTIWNWTGCNDCVDFVSQALKAGGFPTGSVWYVSTSSSAWNITTNLKNHFVNQNWATLKSSISSLGNGDIIFTTGYGHVVMVTGVNPYKYGGHTNDRKGKPVSDSPSLTIYYRLVSTIP